MYDVAGNTVEKNITLNKTKEKQVVEEAIKTAPEEQVIVEAPEPEPPITEKTVEEQPANQGNFLAVIIVLIVLAIYSFDIHGFLHSKND